MRKKGAALRAVEEGEGGRAAVTGAGARVARAAVPAARGAERAVELMTSFTPVPRRYRHDGWTPERQKAFIGALADTGCVTRAAAMVNMSQANCYTLRRAPGAESFRRAWDAALDFGLKRLKDIAFERAIEGYLVPVFVGGKLLGFRRKYNDALLIFCLRHYGQDANGKRTTINYFSTRSSAGAANVGADAGPEEKGSRWGDAPAAQPTGSGRTGGVAQAEASATTVRTVITGAGGPEGAVRDDEAAGVMNGFEGVELDAEAAAAIQAALEACAARAREASLALDRGGMAAEDAAEADPERVFFRSDGPYRGTLEPPTAFEDFVPFVPGEDSWRNAGEEMPAEVARWRDEAERGGG
jgi:hypothetical protein